MTLPLASGPAPQADFERMSPTHQVDVQALPYPQRARQREQGGVVDCGTCVDSVIMSGGGKDSFRDNGSVGSIESLTRPRTYLIRPKSLIRQH